MSNGPAQLIDVSAKLKLLSSVYGQFLKIRQIVSSAKPEHKASGEGNKKNTLLK